MLGLTNGCGCRRPLIVGRRPAAAVPGMTVSGTAAVSAATTPSTRTTPPRSSASTPSAEHSAASPPSAQVHAQGERQVERVRVVRAGEGRGRTSAKISMNLPSYCLRIVFLVDM